MKALEYMQILSEITAFTDYV